MSSQQPPNPPQPNAQQGRGNNRPVQNPFLTANRPPPFHQPIPTVTWNPRRHVANDLQNWAGQNLTPFLRSRYPVIDRITGRVHANHDFDPDIDSAILWSEHIDAFDNNPDLMDELILYLVRPEQADPNIASIAQDRQLVIMLLYRHYQRHGGLVLPPTAGARQAVEAHTGAVLEARQKGVPERRLPRIVFPNWTFGHSTPPPPAPGSAAPAMISSTPAHAGPLTAAKVRESPRGSSQEGYVPNSNTFGAGGAGFLGERKSSRFFGSSTLAHQGLDRVHEQKQT